ncbi:gephyrin-like molybdotransferase Glp [Mesorhizobium opportunistum]|uniref:Molybdopterin molybdenumtransferase n=1 Tax=Mesorhizobium opportunistum (strain LMG 24607 / HAMBI 3007 / WSM2075) TaxID=536019 RepID=F7YAU2_MESOW|nr:gephyrin-like molybdotransferase Glp [Mesorhizobium opportunistum]AEH89918.1 molybdenum cofactor synthesis domain protein [Mesorhizobium opportunistum WSM2075]
MFHTTPSFLDADSGERGKEAIPFDVAVAKAAALAQPTQFWERLSLADALGRLCAVAIGSTIALPQFDNSAMDGFAVRTSDLVGDGPWALRVAERVVAGDVRFHVHPDTGMAIRIFSGAPVPRGFDAVVMQEQCERFGDTVTVFEQPLPGRHVRLAGEDVIPGSVLVEQGKALSSRDLTLLAAVDAVDVVVLKKLRVGLLCTGSELTEPGQSLEHGKIYNSNRVMLQSLLAACPWADIIDFGTVPDNQDLIADVVARAVSSCDALVTTGGVSAGEEDHIAAAVLRQGASLDVVEVAMRPGKPLKVGKIDDMLFAGLPGTPNAALITFRQIVLPALRRLAGIAEIQSQWFSAVAGFSCKKRQGRAEFVPVRISGRTVTGEPVIKLLERGSSANLMAIALADGIAVLPAVAAEITLNMPLRYEPF